MIETVPFDLILNLGVGLGIAFAAKDALRRGGSEAWRRYLGMTLAFEVLVFVPVGAYLYITEPGWSWNYLVDPATVPGWVGATAVAGYALAGTLGYLVGAALVTRGHATVVMWALSSIGVVLAAFFLVFADRFWWVGPYAAYHAGPEASGMDAIVFHRLGWFLGGVGPVFGGALGYIVYRAYRASAELAEKT